MTDHAVGVIGAGGWGTALAVLLGSNDREVTLWARRPELAQQLASKRQNTEYLPNISLPNAIRVTSDLGEAIRHRNLILAVPSQALGTLWKKLSPLLSPDHNVVNAAKGLDVDTGLRLSQVIKKHSGPFSVDRLAVLSGPNHAEEVGLGLPTTSVVAATDPEVSELWQEILMSSTFRVYTNDDIVGVELGGALKNIIALATGISDGLGFGDNTKAALITRGLAEMTRLGVAMGARITTFSGLSGMGDLIATCTSSHSRNTRAGRHIGRGATLDEVLHETPMVIEGVPTCRAALNLAKAWDVDMPITRAVGDVLFDGKPAAQGVEELMTRGPKDELAAFLESP